MNIRSVMRTALGTLTIAEWGIAAANPAATEGRLTLHVHVHNLANISNNELERALENSSRILAAAGVQVVWEPGEADSAEGHTMDMTAAVANRKLDERGFLVVRFVRGFPASVLPGALGFALPSAQSGGHVCLFSDRIETVALSVAPSAAKILGSALAHEIGHVLLGSQQHSQDGIMKAVWTRADYQYLAARQLEFQPREAGVLREEVSRRAKLWQASVGD